MSTYAPTAAPVIKRHPVRGAFWGLLLGLSIALWCVLFAVVAFGDWLLLGILVAVGVVIGIAWAMLAPARTPKGQSQSPAYGQQYGAAPYPGPSTGTGAANAERATTAGTMAPATPQPAAAPPQATLAPDVAASTPPPMKPPTPAHQHEGPGGTIVPGAASPPVPPTPSRATVGPGADDLQPSFLVDDDPGDAGDDSSGGSGGAGGDAKSTIVVDRSPEPGPDDPGGARGTIS